MIQACNVTLRLGKRALFEDVNIKFTEGNCYGLIGANGAGKSTFLKILNGQLEPSKGEVVITPGQRLSFLQQDHFKYDAYDVLSTVIMGNQRLYDIMLEKDAIYAKEDFTEEDGSIKKSIYNKAGCCRVICKNGFLNVFVSSCSFVNDSGAFDTDTLTVSLCKNVAAISVKKLILKRTGSCVNNKNFHILLLKFCITHTLYNKYSSISR